MSTPKKIDTSNLNNAELNNLNELVKKLVTREKDRLGDVTSHRSDHRSSHNSEPTATGD